MVGWGAACYVLATVLTVIHMISSTVFCLLMTLTNLYRFLLKRNNFKKQCVPVSPLGCAFETSSILELSQPETTSGLTEGGRQFSDTEEKCQPLCQLGGCHRSKKGGEEWPGLDKSTSSFGQLEIEEHQGGI